MAKVNLIKNYNLTPKMLYNRVLKGEYPLYNHDNNNDNQMLELQKAKNNYKQTFSLEDKKKIIECEKSIIYKDNLQKKFVHL